MARFPLLALATVASLITTSTGYGFKKPCVLDKDICGWALQSDYGYDNEYLAFATNDANQDTGSGTIIYDSIYNCYPNGEVVWSVWCGGGGTCDKQASASSHAYCKGEPVDTGREPPRFDEGGEEWHEGEDEPWYGEEEPYYPPDEEWYP
ncbi:hypothetical protein B0T16DRAFT_494946 [Cercophora newfieldiana]|uniref:Uncharacterized protein n=1 Tax=Cercophora newfieldiana TaxID=92897 RepID=A0AA39Y123_9PEZI|nr:hypothetical protein B0T16DRAFT_494946 [Cercophora newfieldiana]